MACEFIPVLKKLQKSSKNSIDNSNEYDDFKKYFHVHRNIEDELKTILSEIQKNNTKSLVLICGNAGDGKSNLLAELKNGEDRYLLNGFEIINDATESEIPTQSNLENLKNRLSAFSDQNLSTGNEKIIIAINLGVLNNFIESSFGESFQALKDYVIQENILVGNDRSEGYKEDSVFQHVSFSNFQIFSLTPEGIDTSYLMGLLHRIFDENLENPFYAAYKTHCFNCPIRNRCPIKQNYELFFSDEKKKYISLKVAEVVLKQNSIVTTREFLNLIYDILVPNNFNMEDYGRLKNKDLFKRYYNDTTPILLNEKLRVSKLLDSIQSLSVLRNRSESFDDLSFKYNALQDIKPELLEAVKGTPYSEFSEELDLSSLLNLDSDLKNLIFRFIILLGEMHNMDFLKEGKFDAFIDCLYHYCIDDTKTMIGLEKDVKKSIKLWEDYNANNNLYVIGDSPEYLLLEKIDFKRKATRLNYRNKEVIQRFSPYIAIQFEQIGNSNQRIDLIINHSLFFLMNLLKEGYQPTIDDLNRFTNFESFISELKKLGNQRSSINIVPKEDVSKIFTFSKISENEEYYEFGLGD